MKSKICLHALELIYRSFIRPESIVYFLVNSMEHDKFLPLYCQDFLLTKSRSRILSYYCMNNWWLSLIFAGECHLTHFNFCQTLFFHICKFGYYFENVFTFRPTKAPNKKKQMVSQVVMPCPTYAANGT